jgi:hypothetical protein
MTDTKTPATETDNNEDPNIPSDARVILGPLVKYAAMGLVLVGIIITTAVMMDRQLNDIDREVAELEAQLAQANAETDSVQTADADEQTSPESQTAAVPAEPVNSAITETTVAEKPEASIVNNTVVVPAVAKPVAQTTGIETSPVQTVAAENTVAAATAADDDFFVQPMEEIIAERNAYLKERDLEYLEAFKASQDKKLELMRERLARQEQRIKEMESRYQEMYDIRAADMKEMQERRASFLTDRI